MDINLRLSGIEAGAGSTATGPGTQFVMLTVYERRRPHLRRVAGGGDGIC